MTDLSHKLIFFIHSIILIVSLPTILYAESTWVLHMRTATKVQQSKAIKILNREIEAQLRDLKKTDEVVLNTLSAFVTNSKQIDKCNFSCFDRLAQKADLDGFIYAYLLHKELGNTWFFEMFDGQGNLIDQAHWVEQQNFIFKSKQKNKKKNKKKNKYKGLYFTNHIQNMQVYINGKQSKLQNHPKWPVHWIPLKYGTYNITLQNGAVKFNTKVILNSERRYFIFEGWKGEREANIESCKEEICEGQVLIKSKTKTASVWLKGEKANALDKSGNTLITLPVGKYTIGLRTQHMIQFQTATVKLKSLTRLSMGSQGFKNNFTTLVLEKNHPSVEFKVNNKVMKSSANSLTMKIPKGVIRIKAISKGCKVQSKTIWGIEDQVSLKLGKEPCVSAKKITLACPLIGTQLFVNDQIQQKNSINLDLKYGQRYTSKCSFNGLTTQRTIDSDFGNKFRSNVQLHFLNADLLRIEDHQTNKRAVLRYSSFSLWTASVLSFVGGFIFYQRMQSALEQRDDAFNSWDNETQRSKLNQWSSLFEKFDQEAKSADGYKNTLLSLGITFAISGVVTWLLVPEKMKIKKASHFQSIKTKSQNVVKTVSPEVSHE